MAAAHAGPANCPHARLRLLLEPRQPAHVLASRPCKPLLPHCFTSPCILCALYSLNSRTLCLCTAPYAPSHCHDYAMLPLIDWLHVTSHYVSSRYRCLYKCNCSGWTLCAVVGQVCGYTAGLSGTGIIGIRHEWMVRVGQKGKCQLDMGKGVGGRWKAARGSADLAWLGG